MQLEVILFFIALICGLIQIVKLALIWDKEDDEE